MAAKTMTGARALVSIYNGNTGLTIDVGIWNSFSYSLSYDVSPVFLLGRYSPDELVTTAQEPVSITASGWRVLNHDAYSDGAVTDLKSLLTQEYVVLTVLDRQTSLPVAVIHGCLPTGFSAGFTSRQLSEQTCSYLGLLMDSETTLNTEAVGAATLP